MTSTCLSSAPITVPFPSLSKTRRPSTKSSYVPCSHSQSIITRLINEPSLVESENFSLTLSLDWATCCSIGRKVSKSTSLTSISVQRMDNLSLFFSTTVGSLIMLKTCVRVCVYLQVWVVPALVGLRCWLDFVPELSSHLHTERNKSSSDCLEFCQTAGRLL